jgi:GMP synthase PP-ATPase subunit
MEESMPTYAHYTREREEEEMEQNLINKPSFSQAELEQRAKIIQARVGVTITIQKKKSIWFVYFGHHHYQMRTSREVYYLLEGVLLGHNNVVS